jgi:hypothetical protein
MESVTHALMNHYSRSLLNTKFSVSEHIILNILERSSVVSTQSVLASLSKQIESVHSPREIVHPITSHQWLGLAFPDLAPDQSLNSNTYKSHRYTSRLKQYKAQCYIRHTSYSQSYYISFLTGAQYDS